MCFSAADSTLAAAFFLGFKAACLGAAAGYGSGFLGLADLPVAVISGSLGASMTGWGEHFWFWGGLAEALKTRPLGRRDSSTRLVPCARQRAPPAELSERQGGLGRRYFGPA